MGNLPTNDVNQWFQDNEAKLKWRVALDRQGYIECYEANETVCYVHHFEDGTSYLLTPVETLAE